MSQINDNYPSNSNRSKREETHKVESVIPKGSATISKGPTKKSFASTFLQDDIHSVGTYVLSDVIVPAIKDLLFTTIANSLSMIMFGDIRYNGNAPSWTGNSVKKSSYAKTSYSRYYDQRETPRVERAGGYEYDDLIYSSRALADCVLAKMDEIIAEYGVVSVFEMYDLSNEDAPYTYQNYGWSNIRSARVVPARGGGFIIDMPKALPIR